MRSTDTITVSESEVLVHLCRGVPLGEHVVQLGASREWPAAWHDISPGQLVGERVGLLHLGQGRFPEFAIWEELLVSGAIVLFEGYVPGEPTYDGILGLAERNKITGLHEARHWRGLAVCSAWGKATR